MTDAELVAQIKTEIDELDWGKARPQSNEPIMLGIAIGYQCWMRDFWELKVTVEMDAVEGANFKRWPQLCEPGVVDIDDDLTPENWRPNLLHELFETYKMDVEGWPYEKAHDLANVHERQYRIELGRNNTPPGYMPQGG